MKWRRDIQVLLLIAVMAGRGEAVAQNLWGVNSQGGPAGGGVIYSVSEAGTNYQARYPFVSGNPGESPQRVTPVLWNEKLYGVTFMGGSFDAGVLFEYDPVNGDYSILHEFNATVNGANPYYSLTVLGNRFFGTTLYGGASSSGTIFSYDPTINQFTKLHDFSQLDISQGINPSGEMIAVGSKLYGSASGGTGMHGVLFEYDVTGQSYSRKVLFSGDNGSRPEFGLVAGPGGKLYGTTWSGGAHDGGVIFEYVPGETSVTKRFDFSSATGTGPSGKMILVNGKFFGMTTNGGTGGYGTLFQFDPMSGDYTVKHQFVSTGSNMNTCGLLLSQSGLIYGMTTGIGMFGGGTLFKYDLATEQLSFLYNFNQPSGRFPGGGVTEMPNGMLYGLCSGGGATNSGVLFRYDPGAATYTTHVDFQTGNGRPAGPVSMYNGKLYGVTLDGGPSSYGTLYEFDTTLQTLTELQAFVGQNGNQPHGGVLIVDNELYGMTRFGGSANSGTLYSYDLLQKEFTTLVEMGSSLGVEYPYGQPYLFNSDRLLGLTYGSAPMVFEYNLESKQLSKKLDLPPSFFSCAPSGFVDAIGFLFGTCKLGGTQGVGSIYQYEYGINEMQEVLSFDAGRGFYPTGNLVNYGSRLYGLTASGGLFGKGVLFEFIPATGAFTVLHNFQEGSGGHTPDGSLMLGEGGKLYGLTLAGGSNDRGVTFMYDVITLTYTKRSDFSTNGGYLPLGTNLFDTRKALVTALPYEEHPEITLFPNPVQDELSVVGEFTQLKVCDAFGREVEVRRTVMSEGVKIGVSNLPPGVYFVRYQDGSAARSIRFVRQ